MIISRDGMRVVYVAEVDGRTILMTRRLDELEWRPIAGSEGACQPFFSPDASAVAFFDRVQRLLKRVAIGGGRPMPLCDALVPFGGYWHDDGYLYLGSAREHALVRVAEMGGTPEPVIPVNRDAGEVGLGHARFIGGRKAILYASAQGFSTDYVNASLYLPRTGEVRTIAKGVMNPRYLPTGHVLYAPNGGLLAAPFDANRLEQTAPPVDVSEPQMIVPARTPMHYDVSENGTLVYLPEAALLEAESERRLAWVSLDGTVVPLNLPARFYQWPRISPDGAYFAVAVMESARRSIWIGHVESGSFRRITFGPFDEHSPLWTPDGERIVFTSNRGGGAYGLYWMPSDGSDDPEPLPGQPRNSFPYAWARDGREIIVHHVEGSVGRRLAAVDISDGSVRNVSGSLVGPVCPALSPDGRWIAYASDETGQMEIFVQSYPELRGKWQISRHGGATPVWSPDGAALYYLRGHRMVRVQTCLDPRFHPGAEEDLFECPCVVDRVFDRRMYDIAPEGRRFLTILEGPRTNDRAELRVVLNWFRELERLVPVK